MAASYSVTKVTAYKEANKRVRVSDVTLSGTYTTGGDVLTASALGFRVIEEFIVHGNATDGTLLYTVQPVYGATGVTPKLFETGSAGAGSAEKGSGESLTGVTFRVTVKGF